MSHRNRLRLFTFILAGTACLCPFAAGDIIGLTPGTYMYNPGDTGSPPVIGPDSIQLTTGRDQRRSIFFFESQSITEFTVSFTYRADEIRACGNTQGLTFTVHNDPRGPGALGDPLGNLFGPYGLGYAGITDSAALTIELDTGRALTHSGVYTGGVVPSGSLPTTPVNAFPGNDIDVTLVYDGQILTATLRDTVTGQSNVRPYLLGSLETIVGGPTAIVGFTASTGGGFSSGGVNQYLSNFQFVVPEPTTSLLLLAGVMIMGRRRVSGRRSRFSRIQEPRLSASNSSPAERMISTAASSVSGSR
jgi:hypothetical protein